MIEPLRRLALIAGIALAAPVAAQGVFDMGALTNTLSIPRGPSEPRRATPPLPSARASADPVATALRSFAVRAPVIARFVGNQLDGVDPARRFAALVEGQFDGSKASDATAAYTLLGRAIVHGTDTLDPVAVEAVKAKSARLVAADPRMADAASRDDVARATRINTVIIATGARTAAAAGHAAEYRDAVAAWFRSYGTDLARLDLTPGGLAAR